MYSLQNETRKLHRRPGYVHLRRRTGSTITELLIAATLLLTAISIAGQLTIQARRMWIDIRHHQLALDELGNQLERLTNLDTSTLRSELTSLVPSQPVSENLGNVKLHGEWIDDREGKRIVLSIQWDRPLPTAPMTMVAWVAPTEMNQDE